MGMAALKVKDSLWNFGYSIRTAPVMIKLTFESIHEINQREKEEKKAAKETKEAVENNTKGATDEVILNTAQKAAEKTDGNEDITAKKTKYVSKAMKSDELARFALYYMTTDTNLLKLDSDKERVFVNGIAALFDFGKIYHSSDVSDLQLYDPDSPVFVANEDFVIDTAEFISRVTDDMRAAMEERKKVLLSVSENGEEVEEDPSQPFMPKFTILKDGEDPNKIVHPIFFAENGDVLSQEIVKQGIGISDSLFKLLEDSFADKIGDFKYKYNIDLGGIIYLHIYRDFEKGIIDTYRIDPDIVMGKGICIESNIGTSTIFVPVENHDELIKKIIDNKFYRLTLDEVQDICGLFFANVSLYKYFDMNGTNFSKLSKDEFDKLGKKLSFILNLMRSECRGDLPRLRFESFDSVDNFALCSDSNVLSPMAESNETSSIICEGLKFVINGDDVSKIFNGADSAYKIEKYNEI